MTIPRRKVRITDLLDANQLKQVHLILSKHKDPTSVEAIKALEEYLNQLKAQLQAKGVVPDYLAYLIAYEASKLPKKKKK